MNVTTKLRHTLKTESVDGYRIVSVEWSGRVGATKVTISKDGNLATLTFNEALLSQRAASNAPPALAQMPQSMPAMLPSGPVPVPGRFKQKPGAPPPNPQELQALRQQQELRHQRQREQKLEMGRKRKAVSQRP